MSSTSSVMRAIYRLRSLHLRFRSSNLALHQLTQLVQSNRELSKRIKRVLITDYKKDRHCSRQITITASHEVTVAIQTRIKNQVAHHEPLLQVRYGLLNEMPESWRQFDNYLLTNSQASLTAKAINSQNYCKFYSL